MNARIARTITTIAVYLIAAYPTTPFDSSTTGADPLSWAWSCSRYVIAVFTSDPARAGPAEVSRADRPRNPGRNGGRAATLAGCPTTAGRHGSKPRTTATTAQADTTK